MTLGYIAQTIPGMMAIAGLTLYALGMLGAYLDQR